MTDILLLSTTIINLVKRFEEQGSVTDSQVEPGRGLSVQTPENTERYIF